MDQKNKWRSVVNDLNSDTLAKTDDKLFKYYQSALRDIKQEAKTFIKDYELLSFSKKLEVERKLELGQKIKSILDQANDKATGVIRDSTGEHGINGYYGTFYGLEGEHNINVPLSILGEDYISELVNQPVDGKTFSKRLYKNTAQLAKTTTQSLLQGAIDGKGYAHVAQRITQQTEADYRRSLRIARTEGGRVSSIATQKAYNDAQDEGIGLVKQWVAALDKKTRNSHQLLDGQTVGIDEEFKSPYSGATGKGPRLLGRASEDINCRCTTIPIVNNIKPELRRDGIADEPIANMTYKEWATKKGIPVVTPNITIPPIPVITQTMAPAPIAQPAPPVDDPLRPDFVAKVKRGNPMTRDEANHGKVNPNLNVSEGYKKNCQSCVVSFEARLRGYDVKTLPKTKGSVLDALSRRTNLAWIDPSTNDNPKYISNKDALTPTKFYKFVEQTIEKDKRYTLQFVWAGRGSGGHILSIDRDESGALRLYDPQVNRSYMGDYIKQYFKLFKYTETFYGVKSEVAPKILRIDNMEFNLSVVNNIMEATNP